MKNIAVILAGCGVYDGSEIHEAVLTLLSIERNDAKYQCFAPDIAQHHVIDHITGEETSEVRNVLKEAARIARGNIHNLSDLNAEEFDAVVIPGGFGAAKTLCDFAFKGSELTVLPELITAINAFSVAKKPVGLICIAPAMAGKLFEEKVKFTIGHDEEIASAIEQTGAHHISCSVNDIVIDTTHKLVTTPAYMLAKNISEVDAGINKLITEIISLTQQ